MRVGSLCIFLQRDKIETAIWLPIIIVQYSYIYIYTDKTTLRVIRRLCGGDWEWGGKGARRGPGWLAE